MANYGEKIFTGLIMFVDRITRSIVANRPDNEGLLNLKDGVYTGLYPKELIVNNAPVVFGGTHFAMTPLPDPEDDYRSKQGLSTVCSICSRKSRVLLAYFQ